MAYFKSSQDLKTVLGDFFIYLTLDPSLRQKLLDSNLIIKFNYKDPDASITVDLSGESPIFTFDDANKKPTVEMSMRGDTAHKFWLGKVNLVIALARREITAKGPIPQILKLLPIIKPAYLLYPRFLSEKGLNP